MKKSKIGTINVRNLLLGVVWAMAGSIGTGVYEYAQSIQNGTEYNIQMIYIGALSAGALYFMQAFGRNSDGKLLKKEKK